MASNILQLSNPSIAVNNVAVAVVPNSLVYDEGLGEQKMHVASSGGGNVQVVYAIDVETNLGMVKFQLRSTAYNVSIARLWKTNGNNNVVTLSEEDFTRTFRQAAMTNRYEINASVDGVIDIEFMSLQAV